MDYQRVMIELPALSDEAAASLQNFIYGLMDAVDEHYYRQIQRYYVNASMNELIGSHSVDENQEAPPF